MVIRVVEMGCVFQNRHFEVHFRDFRGFQSFSRVGRVRFYWSFYLGSVSGWSEYQFCVTFPLFSPFLAIYVDFSVWRRLEGVLRSFWRPFYAIFGHFHQFSSFSSLSSVSCKDKSIDF